MIITDAINFLTDNERSLYKVLEWESWKTKLIVTCNIHGDELMRNVTLNELLHRKVIPRCNDCDSDIRRKGLQKKLDSILEGSTYKGVVVQGNTVEVSCSVCATDIYTMAGLCNNTFKTNIKSLSIGCKVSCRCSKVPKYTLDMRELQIKTKMEEDPRGYEFIKWVTEDRGVNDTRFKYLCPLHGEKETSVNNYVNNDRGCIDCRDYNMRWGKYKNRSEELDTLYLMQVKDFKGESFIKIGRTFNPDLRRQNYQEKCMVYPNTYDTVVEGNHEDIYRFEQDVHRELKMYHYIPNHPFGGSIKECFNESRDFIMKTIEDLLTNGDYSTLVLK